MGWTTGLEPATAGSQSGALPTELRPPSSFSRRVVARPAGIEPATAGLEGRCSIRLSYGRLRKQLLIAPNVFFQADARVPCKPNRKCARIISDFPYNRDFGRGRGIRTPDPLLPKQMRYQTAPCPRTYPTRIRRGGNRSRSGEARKRRQFYRDYTRPCHGEIDILTVDDHAESAPQRIWNRRPAPNRSRQRELSVRLGRNRAISMAREARPFSARHAHPEVNAAITKQLDEIAYAYRYLFTSSALEALTDIILRACGGEFSDIVYTLRWIGSRRIRAQNRSAALCRSRLDEEAALHRAPQILARQHAWSALDLGLCRAAPCL